MRAVTPVCDLRCFSAASRVPGFSWSRVQPRLSSVARTALRSCASLSDGGTATLTGSLIATGFSGADARVGEAPPRARTRARQGRAIIGRSPRPAGPRRASVIRRRYRARRRPGARAGRGQAHDAPFERDAGDQRAGAALVLAVAAE